jgi:hypothetical protein
MGKNTAETPRLLRENVGVARLHKGQVDIEDRMDRLEHLVERILMQRLSDDPMGDPLVSHLED